MVCASRKFTFSVNINVANDLFVQVRRLKTSALGKANVVEALRTLTVNCTLAL